jgi:hypothetical protein
MFAASFVKIGSRDHMIDRDHAAHSPDATAAHHKLDALSATLRSATLDALWRQWSAVGGMVSARARATSVVDPEALMLMSLALEAVEPRFGNLLADWARLNSELLSVQRIRNLARRFPEGIGERLATFARIALVEGKDHRWKSIAGTEASLDLGRRHQGKSRATRAQLLEPTALLLRLRLVFGVGIKADLIGFLLSTDRGERPSIGTIATATNYTVAAVRKAAQALAEARVIEEEEGARAEYQADRGKWTSLLGIESAPPWRAWSERYIFVAHFLAWARDADARPLTSYLLESRGRELLEQHPGAFRWNDVWRQPSRVMEGTGADELPVAIDALAQRMMREA